MRQEIITDVNQGECHIVDLLMRVRLREENAFVLIHVENQSTAQSGFPKRMFQYFARLSEEHPDRVYPIVVFSCDEPKRAEPDEYVVSFPGWEVLRFNYKVLQLNRLKWRDFARRDNRVATALLTKMEFTDEERPRVRLECLRMLASHRYDPARTRLLGVFIDSYLTSTVEETAVFEQELAQLGAEEGESVMELMTSWERRGLEQGLEQGMREGREVLVLRQIRKRFGLISVELTDRIDRLSAEELDDLGEAFLDFVSLADLDQWLASH